MKKNSLLFEKDGSRVITLDCKVGNNIALRDIDAPLTSCVYSIKINYILLYYISYENLLPIKHK